MDMTKKAVSGRIDEATWEKMRNQALLEHKTMSMALEEAVTTWVGEEYHAPAPALPPEHSFLEPHRPSNPGTWSDQPGDYGVLPPEQRPTGEAPLVHARFLLKGAMTDPKTPAGVVFELEKLVANWEKWVAMYAPTSPQDEQRAA